MLELSEIQSKKLPELQALAQTLKIENFKKLKKGELQAAIMSHAENAPKPSVEKAPEAAQNDNKSKRKRISDEEALQQAKEKEPNVDVEKPAVVEKKVEERTPIEPRVSTPKVEQEHRKPVQRQEKNAPRPAQNQNAPQNRKNTPQNRNNNQDNRPHHSNDQPGKNKYRSANYEFDGIIKTEGV